jgi:hypothetical protein
MVRQACPEHSRRARHERLWQTVRPELVEACPEPAEGGEPHFVRRSYYSDLLDNEDQALPAFGMKRSATPLLHQR